MLELVLDEGNSSIKYGLFESGQLIDFGRIEGKEELDSILSGKEIQKGAKNKRGRLDPGFGFCKKHSR